MTGQGAVGTFAAQRITGLGQVSHAVGQDIRAGARRILACILKLD